ncbi:hypothetical protein QBC39DRAFT_373524 [Podospora conica]|nr:hypothetical protein QBC39DRAFT_373524 [Schizothecium conicum]
MAAMGVDCATEAEGDSGVDFVDDETLHPTPDPSPPTSPGQKTSFQGLQRYWNDEHNIKINMLYRYNVFWARTKLLRHYHHVKELMNDEVAGCIYRDIHEYSNALRDLQFFAAGSEQILLGRSSGMNIYLKERRDELTDRTARKSAHLEYARSRLERAAPGSDESERLGDTVRQMCESLGHDFFKLMECDFDFEDVGKAARDARWDRRLFGLVARGLAAVGAGLAFLLPIFVMTQVEGKFASAATACGFVFGVALLLAIFVPTMVVKDVIGCTAAYAAVLVVIIGPGILPPEPKGL